MWSDRLGFVCYNKTIHSSCWHFDIERSSREWMWVKWVENWFFVSTTYSVELNVYRERVVIRRDMRHERAVKITIARSCLLCLAATWWSINLCTASTLFCNPDIGIEFFPAATLFRRRFKQPFLSWLMWIQTIQL